jgi:hypothetical protein
MIRATYPHYDHLSLDIDHALRPQVCASVAALQLANTTFDAIFYCQMLEHLTYKHFSPTLAEPRRVTRRRIVASLLDLPLFFLRMHRLRKLLPRFWNDFSLSSIHQPLHDFAVHGQHHWEIGVRGYPLSRIIKDIEKVGFSHFSHFRMAERPYWHFFLLDITK